MTNEELLDAYENSVQRRDDPENAGAVANDRADVLARMRPDWIPIVEAKPGNDLLGINIENEQAVMRWDSFWSAWYVGGTRFFPTHFKPLEAPPAAPAGERDDG